MPRLCSDGQHAATKTSVTLFILVPGEDRYHNDRYRLKFCLRHGRQQLAALYRSGIDTASEGNQPEFCFGCGEPAHGYPFEIMFYEDSWYARFDLVLCEACWATLPSSLGEALLAAEKLPDRPQSSQRGSHANGRI